MKKPSRRVVRIVLPAYNEAGSLAALLDALWETMDENQLQGEIIIVDDGSTDRTQAISEQYHDKMPVILLRHPLNQGLGAALRDGLRVALERAGDRDVILTMDADDTHTPGLMVRMVHMIDEGYDVVIASRYRPESRSYGVPLLRRCLSLGGSWVMRLLFPIRGVRDYTCGYRAYRASVLREAVMRYGVDFVNQDGFQCMVDVLLKLRPMPLIFGEVPLLLRYDRKSGRSKMRVWRTLCQTCGLLARRRIGF